MDVYDSCAAAKEVFEKANQLLGYNLAEICFDGPPEKLNMTNISQPAIFTMSAAMLEVIKGQELIAAPDICGGLSLGEYTALYAADAFCFEDGLKLVQKRGEAMQQAAENSKGTMVSVIGLDEDKIAELCNSCADDQILVAANFNCPGQIVISGQIEACDRAVLMAEQMGAMKAVKLSVAGAFHSQLMQPAADQLRNALGQTDIQLPADTSVIANVTANYYAQKDDISKGLVMQLVSPILWQKCMEKLIADGVERFVEIGPGRVLTGLMKRIDRKIKVENISNLGSLGKLTS